MHPTIAAALRPYMPHTEAERAAYLSDDRIAQMLLARLENLEDAVGVLINAVETYGLDSDEYSEAVSNVREML
jgi:hypothetical protein